MAQVQRQESSAVGGNLQKIPEEKNEEQSSQERDPQAAKGQREA